jgi:hypothetical protein
MIYTIISKYHNHNITKFIDNYLRLYYIIEVYLKYLKYLKYIKYLII